MKQKHRSKNLLIRLTPEEYNLIKTNAAGCNSVSQYIRNAIKSYSDIDEKNKLNAINNLADSYKRLHTLLYHTSANLNQAMKRANELNIAGLLTAEYIKSNIANNVTESTEAIIEIKTTLNRIMQLLLK